MGSKSAAQARNAQRQADTAELMQNIRTGGEISKKREAELEAAANRGRGIQFIPGSPTVKGVMQIDPATGGLKPVFRTGATAADYTGRIASSAPTFGELLGDAGRALFGGTADKQVFTLPTSRPGTPTMDFANMVPDPRPTQGIIPAILNTGGLGGLALNIIQDLVGKGKNFFFPEEEEDTFSSAADAIGGASVMGLGNIRTQKNLAGTTGDEINQSTQREVGPTVDLRTPTIEELVTTPVSETVKVPTVSEVPANIGGFAVQGAPADFITTNRAFFYPEDYTLPFTNTQIPSLGRFIESVFTGGQGAEATERLTPAGEALYNTLTEQEGLTRDEAISRIRSLESTSLAMGGSVPPEKGPMSQGVGSLFQER